MRRHTSFLTGAVSALTLTLLPAATAWAFGLHGVGGNMGMVKADGVTGTGVFGAHLEFERPATRLHLAPSLMVWSEDGVRDVNPNFDFFYHFNPEGYVSPYLGMGAAIHAYHYRRTDTGDTDLGANLLGGFRFPMSGANLAVESRYAVSDRSQFTILGKVTVDVR